MRRIGATDRWLSSVESGAVLRHGPKVAPVVRLNEANTGHKSPKRSDVPLSDNSGGSCVYCGDSTEPGLRREAAAYEHCAQFLMVGDLT